MSLEVDKSSAAPALELPPADCGVPSMYAPGGGERPVIVHSNLYLAEKTFICHDRCGRVHAAWADKACRRAMERCPVRLYALSTHLRF